MNHAKCIMSYLSPQSNLPDDIFESGKAAEEKRPLSLSFSDLQDGDCVFTSSSATSPSSSHSAHPEITITPAELTHSSLSSQNEGTDDSSSASSRNSLGEDHEPKSHPKSDMVEPGKPGVATRSGTESLFLENSVAEALLQESDEVSELKPVELDTFEGNITKQLVKRLTSAEGPITTDKLFFEGSVGSESEAGRSFLDGSLEDAFNGLFLALDPHKEQYKEFQDLNQEVTHLDDVLKVSTFLEKKKNLIWLGKMHPKPTLHLR